MTLAEFRATRRTMPIAAAIAESPYLEHVAENPEYTHAALYADGAYILQSRRGFYLEIEGDEYKSRDLALLEFVLWQWVASETPDLVALRTMIWG